MKSKLKFHSLVDGDGGGSMYELLTDTGYEAVTNPFNADIIVFNGGADIGSSIYGENNIRGVPYTPSNRDLNEIDLFNGVQNGKTPRLLVGICRGAQLLNCLSGGTLWQDVNNHGRDHSMVDLRSGETLPITSTHHQMMRPGHGAEIWGVSHEATHKEAEAIVIDGCKEDDMEVVWYSKTGALCIQGHPEYVPGSRYAEYCLDLIKECYAKCAA